MTQFPQSTQLAKTFLLYTLGKSLNTTSYETIAERRVSPVFLSNTDLVFLDNLGVYWNRNGDGSIITKLLGKHFLEMNKAGVTLEFSTECSLDYTVRFVSLRE
ncbi:MAG TPA: hypothetical protein VIM37_01695 [Candidatus Microsaccharimonas sp.]|jgi:hypothetical protein